MSSLFRKRWETYRPDPNRIWNRNYWFAGYRGGNTFDLLWARERFDLSQDHPDMIALTFQDSSKRAVLKFGRYSEIPTATLADYQKFEALECYRYQYIHERDHPMEDEDSIAVHLFFRAREQKYLCFFGQDYAKLRTFVQSEKFLKDMESLARRIGCHWSLSRCSTRPPELDWHYLP